MHRPPQPRSVEELQEDDTPTIIQRKPKTSQETTNE